MSDRIADYAELKRVAEEYLAGKNANLIDWRREANPQAILALIQRCEKLETVLERERLLKLYPDGNFPEGF